MKARSFKVFATALLLTGMMVSTSFATDFVSASVNKTRSTGGDVEVQLNYTPGTTSGTCEWGSDVVSGTNTNYWFAGPTGMDDQILAIALTALSLGKDVRVGVETCPSGTGTSTVLGVFSSIGLEQ